MKNNHSILILTLLLLASMSCQFLTHPASIPIAPSAQVQATQTASALPATVAPSPTRDLIPSEVPPALSATVSVSDVTNTHWKGSIYDEENPLIWEVFEIIFLPGGKLRYYTPNEWSEKGTWQQKGDDILLETNNHGCDFYGVMYGDTIAGARKCMDGKTWGWSVQLQTP